MPKVAFVTESLRRYRKPFHELLRKELASSGIDYILIYGSSAEREAMGSAEAEIDWGTKIRNRYFRIGSLELCWQPCLGLVGDSDLVIAGQANRLLVNYPLILKRVFGRPKVAFFGHGRNFQSRNPDSLRERFKRLFVNRVDWWFAYTSQTVRIIEGAGFPANRITNVQNSIDTGRLKELKKALPAQDLDALRKTLALQDGPVGIFCGGMYPEKEIPFLIESCRIIRQRIPGFQMIFLGAGPSSGTVARAAEDFKWMRYAGPRFDLEKVKYFCLADVFLLPGLVGLALLDSFALEVPMVTTRYPFHSPEIAYLENGVNGIITEYDLKGYADGVVGLLSDRAMHERIIEGCRASAGKYTIENMVKNFAAGIRAVLESKR
jgi:glycosyltransferase involved in cell wall biosynthesis